MQRIIIFLILSFGGAHLYTAQNSNDMQFDAETKQKLERALLREWQEAHEIETNIAAMCASDSAMNTSADKAISQSTNQKDQKQEAELKQMQAQQKDLVDACAIMYQLKPVYTELFNNHGLPEDLQLEVFDYLQEIQINNHTQARIPFNCQIVHANPDKTSDIIMGFSTGDIVISNLAYKSNEKRYKTGNSIKHLATYDDNNGNWYIVAAHENESLTILNGKTGAILRTIEIEEEASIKKIATHSGPGGAWYIICLQVDEQSAFDTLLFNGNTGDKIGVLQHPNITYDFTTQNFADGGWAIITASDEIRLWDGVTNNLIRTIDIQDNEVDQVISYVDSNNNWFIIAALFDNESENYATDIYNGKTGILLHTLYNHSATINKLFTHADAQGNWYIISASEDKNICVTNGATGELYRTFSGKRGDVVSFVDAYNNWYIAYGDREGFSVWDVVFNKKIQSLPRVYPTIPDEDGGIIPNYVSSLFVLHDKDNNPNIFSGEAYAAGPLINTVIGVVKYSHGPGEFEREKKNFETKIAFFTHIDDSGLTGHQQEMRALSNQELQRRIVMQRLQQQKLISQAKPLIEEARRRKNEASSSSASQPAQRTLQISEQLQGASSSSSSSSGQKGTKRKFDDAEDGRDDNKRIKRDEPGNGNGSSSSSAAMH